MKLFPLLLSIFSDFRPAPTGFGTRGISRQRECGALTLLGSATAAQRGVELPETGVAVLTLTIAYFPEVNERRGNNLGETDGRAVSTLSSREIDLEAEVTGTTGRMTDTFVAAITTLANDVADFGSPTGGIYLHRATVTQARADWRKVNFHYESNPLLA